MARYIDATQLQAKILDAKIASKLPESREVLTIFDNMVRSMPTADVVQKSEVDNWYQLYHAIKEELKQEKMYHRETEKLCDRYCIESQHAKRQVAREIFEEIEELAKINTFPVVKNGVAEIAKEPFWCIDPNDLAELKKKYTEEK